MPNTFTAGLRDYGCTLVSLDLAARAADIRGSCALRRGGRNGKVTQVDGQGRLQVQLQDPKESQTGVGHRAGHVTATVDGPANAHYMHFATPAVMQLYLARSDEEMAATDGDTGHPTGGVGLFVTSVLKPVLPAALVTGGGGRGWRTIGDFRSAGVGQWAKLSRVSAEEAHHAMQVVLRQLTLRAELRDDGDFAALATELGAQHRSLLTNTVKSIRVRGLSLGQARVPSPKLFRHLVASALMDRGFGAAKTRAGMRLAVNSEVLFSHYLRGHTAKPFGSQFFMGLRTAGKEDKLRVSRMIRLGLPFALRLNACVVRTVISHGGWGSQRIRDTLAALLYDAAGGHMGVGPALMHWSPGRAAMLGANPGALLQDWFPLIFTIANGFMAESIVAAHPWSPVP